MIWAHMAANASEVADSKRKKKLAPFFAMLQEQRQPLKPDAEECFQKSLELAPDRLESYVALFELQRSAKRLPQAKQTGLELLKRFPRHAATLEAIGEIFLETQDYKKAQEYFEQSLQANPLDRSLRGKLARARQKWGLELTLAHKYDEARQQYELALKLWEGSKTTLLCQWAAAEIKAKAPQRADELMAQAQAIPDQRLACRYALVSEGVRAALSTKEKKQQTDELKKALAQEPTPGEILALLEAAAQQRQTHDKTFRGQKTHEKTILKFLEQITFDQFSETQLERLCTGLQGLQARKPWLNCLEFARRRFLKNSFFRMSWVDYYLTGASPEGKTHLAREHLDQARRLAESMPRGEQQQQLQEQIQEKEKAIAELSSGQMTMFDMMRDMFGGFGGFGGDDEDEEDF